MVVLTTAGCASFIPASGPSESAVAESAKAQAVKLVDLTVEVAKRLIEQEAAAVDLSSQLDNAGPVGVVCQPGDVLDVSIWEAPPGVLFTNATLAGVTGNNAVNLPAQVVSAEGEITVPFIGRLQVAGKTTNQIEADIVRKLSGKAHMPQAVVRITNTVASDVTVVGEVNKSLRMPLSPRGERLLDAIAAAGGTKAPVEKVTIQLARAGRHYSLPLETVIKNPRQNVRLAPGDVVTVYHQPGSFMALGAVSKPGEVPFEATGINLAQAVARVGGALDNRANPQGVFVFRNGEEPLVYRVNLLDPSSMVAMREFRVRDGDIIYVANAPAVELQKFMSVVASIVYPASGFRNVLQ
jgi:polysaccharide export outer membrane protein